MTARMLSESDRAITRAVEALNVSSFPDDISPEHGEYDVRFLCEKFGFSFTDVKLAYREYKDSRGTVTQTSLQMLINSVDTPVSTTACDRELVK